MKKVDIDTIGGRIRALRADSGMTIIELAKAIDITPHYLSTVELNGKIPSDTLIRRISEVLGVSREYIKNGGDMAKAMAKPAEDGENHNIELKPSSVYDADSTLLLKIVTGLVPQTEQKKLKSMQPAEVLEYLIQSNADMIAFIEEWSKVYNALQHIQQMQKLNDTLRDFMRKKLGPDVSASPDAEEQKEFVCDSGESFTVAVRTIQFGALGFTWSFQYLYLESVTKEQAKAILEQEKRDGERVSLLFTDEQLWNDFFRYAQDVFPDDGGSPLYPYSVNSLILIDAKEWEIRSENEMFLDIETLRGIPMADLLEEG